MNFEQIFEQILKKRSFLCVGLDSDIKKIPQHLLQEKEPVFEFNKAIIDAQHLFPLLLNPILLSTKV